MEKVSKKEIVASMQSWSQRSEFYCSYKNYLRHANKLDGGFIKAWRSGGTSGGSCWGHVASAITPDGEPDFEELNSFLEEYVPSLSFMHYNKLLKCLDDVSAAENGYYGNRVEFSGKFISFEDLSAFLEDHGYLA